LPLILGYPLFFCPIGHVGPFLGLFACLKTSVRQIARPGILAPKQAVL
jgi:hypothetical protein